MQHVGHFLIWFVFSSCDFVDRPFVRKNKGDPRSHTNQHETHHPNRFLRQSSAVNVSKRGFV